MSTELQTTNTQVSNIIDDPEAIAVFREKMQNFTKILNAAPKKEKIKQHQGYEYLPISTVEKELDKMFFGLVQYECVSYSQIFNEIACHARIKVFHPVINQWMVYDGLGSAVIQQDSGTKVYDFNQFKKANALQLTLPKAYAEAIKNAAKKIGKRFGADINRKHEDEYEPMPIKVSKKSKNELEDERVLHLIQDAQTIEELDKIKNTVPEHLRPEWNDRCMELENAAI